MWLFKKQKKQPKGAGDESVWDKAAHKIVASGYVLQRGFASTMNKRFNHMSVKKLKTILVLFCVAFGSLSIYFIVHAMAGPPEKKAMVKIDQVDVPGYFNKAGDEEIPFESYVEDETFKKIAAFKTYMDSLKKNNQFQYNSILASRPQLMDSILMLERIYLQKQK